MSEREEEPAARRDLRLYTAAQSLSTAGGTLTNTAVAVVAVAGLHAGPGQVALVLAAGTGPALLLGPVAGVLLDRVRRPRRMLLTADLVAATAVGGCALAALAGVLSLAVLAGLAATLGLVRVVVEGLYFPHLGGLGVRDLGRARARLQSATMLSRSAGGTLAGPVAAAAGAALLFAGDALTYLFSAGCLLRLRARDHRELPDPGGRPNLRREFAAGVRVLRRHRLLAAVVLFFLVSGAAEGAVAAQRAVLLLDVARLPVAWYGIPAVVAALLGAAGALLAPRLLARGIPAARLLLAGLPAAALAGLALPLVGGPPARALVLACSGVGLPVLFGSITNIALVALVARDIGDAYFARVTLLMGTTTTAAGMLGTLAGGVLGQLTGVRAGITAAMIVELVAAVVLVAGLRRPAPVHPAAPSDRSQPSGPDEPSESMSDHWEGAVA